MSLDEALFRYEYVDGDDVHFVIAVDRQSRQIEAIFGYLPCSRAAETSKRDIWGSMWMVNSTHENMPLLSIELARRVISLVGYRAHIGNGANPKTTIPLRRLYFGGKGVAMKHHYMLNLDMVAFKVAVVNQRRSAPPRTGESRVGLRAFHSIEELAQCFDVESVECIPYKDSWYINKRYICHPYYTYQVFGVQENGKTGALLVARAVRYNGGTVLRIVDYIGEQSLFADLGGLLEGMLKDNQYEYIDFYEHGFDEPAVAAAGFIRRTADDVNIIPNYFEPFLQVNVEIYAHYKTDGTLFFKADGDQDRPNVYVPR